MRTALPRVVHTVVLAAALVLSAGRAQAQTFTFEELGDGEDVPGGYAALTWSNFAVLNVGTFGTPSGFLNSAVSGVQTVYNPFGDPASFGSTTPFVLTSAHFTAGWEDGLRLRIVGSLAGATVFTMREVLGTAGPRLVHFGGVTVDHVAFEPDGDEPYQFAMDDLTIAAAATTVPEPGTVALLATGLLGVGGASLVRRRRG